VGKKRESRNRIAFGEFFIYLPLKRRTRKEIEKKHLGEKRGVVRRGIDCFTRRRLVKGRGTCPPPE